MNLKIADLRERVTIKRPQKYTDAEGNIIEENRPELLKVWAKILPESARNSDGYFETVREVRYKIFLRNRQDVRISDCIEFNGRTFEQVAPPYLLDGRKKFLVLQARELKEDA